MKGDRLLLLLVPLKRFLVEAIQHQCQRLSHLVYLLVIMGASEER